MKLIKLHCKRNPLFLSHRV